MDKLKCWLGFHAWGKWGFTVQGNKDFRYCPRCGKCQEKRVI